MAAARTGRALSSLGRRAASEAAKSHTENTWMQRQEIVKWVTEGKLPMKFLEGALQMYTAVGYINVHGSGPGKARWSELPVDPTAIAQWDAEHRRFDRDLKIEHSLRIAHPEDKVIGLQLSSVEMKDRTIYASVKYAVGQHLPALYGEDYKLALRLYNNPKGGNELEQACSLLDLWHEAYMEPNSWMSPTAQEIGKKLWLNLREMHHQNPGDLPLFQSRLLSFLLRKLRTRRRTDFPRLKEWVLRLEPDGDGAGTWHLNSFTTICDRMDQDDIDKEYLGVGVILS